MKRVASTIDDDTILGLFSLCGGDDQGKSDIRIQAKVITDIEVVQ